MRTKVAGTIAQPGSQPDLREKPRRPVTSTCAPGMARYFIGASPLARFCRAAGKEKDKGVVARRGLKEVQSEAVGR